MEKIVNYSTLCDNYRDLTKKSYKALIDTLNKRGVESINVKAYMDEDLIDYFTFPQTDKNGYGVNVKIDIIKKNDKGEWVVDVVDEDDDDWGTLELTDWNFDASGLIDILGIVEGIFECADEDYNGYVLSAEQDFEELEELLEEE